MKTSAAWQKLVSLGYKPKKNSSKRFAFKVEKDKQPYFFGYDEDTNAAQFLQVTTIKHRVHENGLIVHADIIFYPEKEIAIFNGDRWWNLPYGIPFIEFQGNLLQIPKNDKIAIKMLEDKAYYPLYDYLSEK